MAWKDFPSFAHPHFDIPPVRPVPMELASTTETRSFRRLAGARDLPIPVALLACLLSCVGCGTTKIYTATEQLLLSDAVDATVAQLDFTPLTAKRVYLDATYLKTVKTPLLIDSDYVISSLRQQMVSAGVLLVESREEAEIVAEARMGALGMDGHNVIYGIPANNSLSTASAAVGGTPLLPAIPEISVVRREGRQGTSKLAVFAYDRETRQPYWQSGMARSTSDSKDTWVLGIGPFQRGTIHDGTRFAGGNVLEEVDPEIEDLRNSNSFVDYHRQRRYSKGRKSAPDVVSASDQGSTGGVSASASDGVSAASGTTQPVPSGTDSP